MKIYAHYDHSGVIRSIVAVNAPEGAGMMLTPKPGVFVSPIKDVKIRSDTPDLKELRAIAERHRVTPFPHATLAKKR